ncbi:MULTISPECIES: 3-deoxy-D-manno-octulosonic acid transferase [unclassified Roseovarius]|uniref:3-deoxy-D-manno-octulosonic acid transferase n=1 Tax=unclassified Roseovarius TaxID=2614913 RepID=UPI00273EED7E|nr:MULTISPECIES: 3-deoxy-D-manno-octulosonic acid transferase [unclassified Roseovarius]
MAANLIAPLAYRRVAAKLRAHGTDPARFRERMGHATAPRPDGTVIWFHAASVGESLSVLRLIAHMGELHPGWHFLLTSGTATSAEIVGRRLPPRCTHQFAPLDARRAMRRFLDHWHPSAAIFVESELWPQMLQMTRAAGIPLALLNARISDRSARNWKRFPATSQHLMGHFSVIHTQDARTTDHLHDLGLTHAYTGQNLKSVSGPLPFDAVEKSRLEGAVGGRPIWVASSTHSGEDEIMIAAQKTLLRTCPDLLLILVPRHPDRARTIAALIDDADLISHRRSAGQGPSEETQVYLADTLGETGLWYALSPITCLCGSFTPVGGHNPYEPAYAGSAVLHGPLYANFAQTYADFDANGGAREVKDTSELAREVNTLLTDVAARDAMQEKSRAFAAAQDDMLDTITETLTRALDLAPAVEVPA